jgi:hypothetical protein
VKERLTLLIHWIGFVFVIGGVVIGIGSGGVELISAMNLPDRTYAVEIVAQNSPGFAESLRRYYETATWYKRATPSGGGVPYFVEQFLLGAALLGIGLFLYVLKWILVGNKKFFPWKS